MSDTPRVWVGCLACYNDGTLLGEWVDADEAGDFRPHGDTAEDVFTDEIGNPHEELWCFDHEGFDGFLDGECSPFEAQQIAEAIEAIPDYIPTAAVAAYLDNIGAKIGAFDEEDFNEAYCGEWDSEADYAEEYAEEIGAYDPNAANTWPSSYIDWSRAADELDLWTAKSPNYKLFVFRSI